MRAVLLALVHSALSFLRSPQSVALELVALGHLQELLAHQRVEADVEPLQAGIAQGLFRAELNARDLYLMIASMAYFYLSNRFTLSSFLGENLEAPAALAHWETFVTDAVRRTVGTSAPA